MSWLATFRPNEAAERSSRIESFLDKYHYAPNAVFIDEAQTLYERMISLPESTVGESLAASEGKLAELAASDDTRAC